MSRRSRQLALVFAAELAALATTATGQAFQPAGDEFQANTYTRCNQSDPRVAALPDGAFVIVWESGSVDCRQDSDVSGVFAPRSTNTLCGDGARDGQLSATDALVTLGVSVGSAACEVCVCDANGSGGITATDGLLVPQAAVGQPVALECAPC